MPAGNGSEVITGKDNGGNAHDEMARAMATTKKKKYESYINMNLVHTTVDMPLAVLSGLPAFAKVVRAHQLLICSDVEITVKFNANTEDEVKVKANIPFPLSALEVTNIFFSNNSGGPAVVDVILI